MDVALGSVALAATINTMVKGAIATAIAPASLARPVGIGLLGMLAGGAIGQPAGI